MGPEQELSFNDVKLDTISSLWMRDNVIKTNTSAVCMLADDLVYISKSEKWENLATRARKVLVSL